jgi:hypothetical protein
MSRTFSLDSTRRYCAREGFFRTPSEAIAVPSSEIEQSERTIRIALLIYVSDRWIDSITDMTGIVPQLNHRLGQAVFVAEYA